MGVAAPVNPLTASISGPTSLAWKQTGTFTAGYAGGSGAPTFQWYARSPGSTTWNVVSGATAPTYAFSMVFTDGRELRVAVTRGSETASATRYVAYRATSPCFEEAMRGEDPLATAAASAAPTYETALVGAAPNPARGSTSVRFTLAEPSAVRLVVYDGLGREVARLVDSERGEGAHEARLDAGALAPGVYVVRMEAGRFVATQRLTLLR